MAEIRQMLRGLWRNPGFTAVAVLTLALGIGANAAVFSVVDAALFRPLPYRDAGRLVEFISVKEPGTPRQRNMIGMTRDEVEIWRQQAHIFEAIEMSSLDWKVTGGVDPQREAVGQLSPGMLEFLGIRPTLGREFAPDESTAGARVALIGESVWRTRFGGDPAVLGQALELDRTPHTIVGVIPANFRYPFRDALVWVPLPPRGTSGQPWTSFVDPLARLSSNLSLEEAQRRIDAVSARLEREQPRKDGWTTRLAPLDRDRTDAATRTTLLVLLATVGFVLLIASANVANLFLVRNVTRQREIAVRAAIGASSARLMRQFLFEGLIVATLGAVVAALTAGWVIDALRPAAASILQWTPVFDPELNRRVLVFLVGVAGIAALASAAFPALSVVRRDLYAGVLTGSRVIGFSPRHHRISQGIALLEVAATFVLLLGAGLLANSFVRLVSVDTGFDTRHLMRLDVELPEHRYTNPASYEAAHQQILDSLRALPWVRGVIATGPVPPAGMLGGTLVIEEDPTPPSRGFYSTNLLHVAPEHFRFLGIPVVEGRSFDRTDLAGPPVAIVDRETAGRHWPSGSALGQRIQVAPGDSWRTIVGVVGRVTVRNGDGPQIYVPISDAGYARDMVIRHTGNAEALTLLIRERIRVIDREIMMSSISSVEDNYKELFARPRVFVVLMSVFAAVALVLAVIGLYGVLAYFVNQRTQEIGIRIALGARTSEVRRMVVGEAMLPVGAGLLLGLGASFGLNTYLSTLLYEVTPHDTGTIVGVGVFLMLVSLGATLLPAGRAAKVDPVVALRAE